MYRCKTFVLHKMDKPEPDSGGRMRDSNREWADKCAHTRSQACSIMLSWELSRQYSNGPALNGGLCRRGQEWAGEESSWVSLTNLSLYFWSWCYWWTHEHWASIISKHVAKLNFAGLRKYLIQSALINITIPEVKELFGPFRWEVDVKNRPLHIVS